MNNKQGDEEVIEKIVHWLVKTFPKLEFKVKVPLKELFSKPESLWLRRFWSNNSHADIATFRHRKLVCIIEPGGKAHFSDEKQKVRDQKKAKICKINGVSYLPIANSVITYLHKPVTKKLLKRYFYGEVR